MFASFLSAFLIELLNRLEPDPMDIIQDVLIYQTQMMRNSSLGPYVPADFSPPEYIVLVNALFYASLGVMLLAAFIAMLIKGWAHEFDRGLGAISIPEQRAKTREFRYLGMERWKLQEMVAMLPFLIQVSLLLFSIGLVIFLFHIDKPSFGVTTAIFGAGVLYYAITTTISVLVTSSPFHSPLSRTLGKVYQRAHAYFCPVLDDFLSPKMDTAPVAVLGRLWRRVQIFLQKSRPCLERDFVEPITAMTVDDFQLSTTASALQRLHDSMPNSQHSEEIQQSIWQVASSSALRMRPLIKLPSWILDRGKDTEYFSQLPSVNGVALTAIFVRMRDPRYRNQIAAVEHVPKDVSASDSLRAQVVSAIFGLLPEDFTYHTVLHGARLRRALRLDAFLFNAFPHVPSVDGLRDKLLRESLRESVDVGHAIARALYRNMDKIEGKVHPSLFCRALSNHPCFIDAPPIDALPELLDAIRGALRDAPLPLFHALLYDALRGNADFDDMTSQGRIMRLFLEPKEPVALIDILTVNQLHETESIWLLNTLSGLHCDGLVMMRHYASKICQAILMHQVPQWNPVTPPNIMLIEAVVTLLAISCSVNQAYQMITLTNSNRHSWLLLNLRNPDLISKVIEDIDENYCAEVISVLFLVIYALILRGSGMLAEQHLAGITSKAGFVSCASALTLIAPVLGDNGFHEIGELLLAARTQFLPPMDGDTSSHNMSDFSQLRHSDQHLFNNYDLQFGANMFPEPKIGAILLLLSKDLSRRVRSQLEGLDIKLRNPWLQFVACVTADVAMPDQSHPYFWPPHDSRLVNMFGALFLLRFLQKQRQSVAIQCTPTESVLLTSFLQSKEPAICLVVLYHYMEMVYSTHTPPSRYLPPALRAVFNFALPECYLPKGWDILRGFMAHSQGLPAAWRGTFAEAFFTLSRRPLPRRNGRDNTRTGEPEIREVLTWKYFCEGEQAPELTDERFSGVDWMAQAWSLHLAQQPGTQATGSGQSKAQSPTPEEAWLNGRFVLQTLHSLLIAAPSYSILPNIPQILQFVEWFDDQRLTEYQSGISACIEEARLEYYRRRQFQRFFCMWYI